MEKIIVLFAVMLFVEALFIKWNVFDLLSRIGSQSQHRFFYEMFNCLFCIRFHLSIIITLVSIIFFGFYKEALIMPFVVTGLMTLKRN